MSVTKQEIERARFAVDLAKNQLESLKNGRSHWVDVAQSFAKDIFPHINDTRKAILIDVLHEAIADAVADEELRLRGIISLAVNVLSEVGVN